jgi:Amt family ammonium transporter
MKKIAAICYSLFLGLSALGGLSTAHAEDAAPTPPPANADQRIADLEAYVNNGAVGTATADGKTVTWTSNLTASGPGHNAWLMTSSALVLMMTLPGLGLFYGGLTRKKNVLSVLAQMLGIAGLVSILWWICGYSFSFANGSGASEPFYGGADNVLFKGVTSIPNAGYSAWAGQNVFAMFQLMFAIITPALIVGSIAERMKFTAVLFFVTLWMFVVYFPMAHMVWGGDGFMNGVWNAKAGIHAIDFAGGTVVHMTSGWTGLVLCLILGKRLGFGKEPMPPHSLVLTFIGTGLLWVGWYGFNAGSAGAADVVASNAFTTTTLATATASFVWAAMEFIFKKKASVLGFCSGAIAGLVVITPACGFVNATGSMWIGLAAGIVPFLTVTYLKPLIGYDDALDTFGVHAVGGTLGAFLTGVLADPAVNSNLATNLSGYISSLTDKDHPFIHALWIEQVKAIGVTLALVIVGTLVIGFLTKLVIGLRPTTEQESQGLDITDHGEEGYIL